MHGSYLGALLSFPFLLRHAQCQTLRFILGTGGGVGSSQGMGELGYGHRPASIAPEGCDSNAILFYEFLIRRKKF